MSTVAPLKDRFHWNKTILYRDEGPEETKQTLESQEPSWMGNPTTDVHILKIFLK